MNIISHLLSVALCCLTLSSAHAACPDINDDLEARRAELAKPLVIDSILNADLSAEQREALQFLYAYMPLTDIASHPLGFFIANVNTALQARAEMPWGEIVPQREFMHFVLPPRVNNENLDLARPFFYRELKDRIKHLSMKEAILEVNHWCHEKVTYKPSDQRTSPPLSTLSQAIGRCGEESTFAVAALRAVGIPARQVYTPRWAHTDDNHAWVEAWADGKWHFIGACEPEPMLNMAWFNAPAARGMLMATNVIGRYDGPEEKIFTSPRVTRINVTDNYAPVDVIRARAVYEDGSPAKNSLIRFGIYNYSVFFPVAVKKAGDDGRASLTTGLGDMVIWATDGRMFGFATASPDEKEVNVVLKNPDAFDTKPIEFNIVPPQPSGKLPKATDEQRRVNDLRFQYEDSLRAAYEATFFSTNDTLPETLASRLDSEAQLSIKRILTLSRGNHNTILSFLCSLSDKVLPAGVSLLTVLNEKDLRDITAEVLNDCINHATPKSDGLSDELYLDYVIAPRVLWEPLSATKAFFKNIFDETKRRQFADNTQELVKYVTDSINLDLSDDPFQLQSTPLGVWEQRKADPASRSIFFVQAARACGIPARIESVTGKTQFASTGSSGAVTWYDVFTTDSDSSAAASAKGLLNLSFEPTRYIIEPKYYHQFAISKIVNGEPVTLDLAENTPFKQLFSRPMALDTGRYMLTTGQRMANGTVLARTVFFEISEGKTTDVALIFRQDNTQPAVIGNLNAENLYFDLDSKSEKSILSTTGRGYYVLAIIHPNQEPTVHAINELSASRKEIESAGNAVILLFTGSDAASRFQPGKYGKLPASVHFGIDGNGCIMSEIAASLHLGDNITLPLFVVADSFNRIVYVSEGYTIGLADRILRTLRKINDPK